MSGSFSRLTTWRHRIPKLSERDRSDDAGDDSVALWKRPFPHVKVAFVFAVWVSVLIPQARLIADLSLFSVQAMIAVGALPVCTVLIVYLYPPLTPRWRTLVWVLLAATAAGAGCRAAWSGRAGIVALLAAGGLTLLCRSNGNARLLVRWLRERRAGGKFAIRRPR